MKTLLLAGLVMLGPWSLYIPEGEFIGTVNTDDSRSYVIELDCGDGVTIPYADETTGLVGQLLDAGCVVVKEWFVDAQAAEH